jgi:DNA-binding helix-turn-helix protein
MDINKLKGKIREKRLTYKILAQKIGIGLTSMNYKINGKNLFNQEEMKKLKEALRLTDNETIDIFFS